jgi:hypothetical protein
MDDVQRGGVVLEGTRLICDPLQETVLAVSAAVPRRHGKAQVSKLRHALLACGSKLRPGTAEPRLKSP